MFKKLIGIASCKGGVGKSTVAINLAVYMSLFKKQKIGLLDADLYGPSHPVMLGITQTYKTKNELVPQEKYGIYSMSLGYFLSEESSVLLRGPIISNTITYLLKKTQWDNLDILIIDFPPGTGDIYLSLLRDFNFDGILLITTPQLVSTTDVQKSILMLKKFNISIIGILENMNVYKCKSCGSENKIYGDNKNLLHLTEKFNIPNIYTLKFDEKIIESCDKGIPFVYSANNNDFIKTLEEISSNIIKNISK